MAGRRSPKLQEAIDRKDAEAVLELMPERQRLFCYEFLKDLNASQAVIRAGYNTAYPEKIGNALKNKPAVQIALAHLQQARQEKLKVDAGYVVDKIVKAIERAEKKGNEMAVLRGAEILGKHIGMFVDRQEISGPDGQAIEIKQEEIKRSAEEVKGRILALAQKNRPSLFLVKDDDDGDSGEE